MPCDFDRFIDRRCTESAKWRRYDDDVLPMWVADMDFAAPDRVVEALRRRVEHGVFGYGMEPPELRPAVIERLWRLYGWSVGPEALVFIPGVVRGLNLACHAVGAEGDGVLVQTPVYPPFFTAPANARRALRQMALTRGPDGHYTVDLDRFEGALCGGTRLFALCNPHNPVGRAFTRQELEAMATACLRHDVVICSDEIHCDLVFRGHRHVPVATLGPEVAARTITLMAPSKTFNIAGLDCSVAIIQDAELRERFNAARQGLVPGVNVLGYVAALAAYCDGQPWLDELLGYLEGNRALLCEAVDAMPGVTMAPPEATFLGWLDCRALDLPGGPQRFFLERARVAMNDGASFGRGGEGFVRLNFGCCRSTLEEALERMQRAIEAWRAG